LSQLWPSFLQQVQSLRVGNLASANPEAGQGVPGVLQSAAHELVGQLGKLCGMRTQVTKRKLSIIVCLVVNVKR